MKSKEITYLISTLSLLLLLPGTSFGQRISTLDRLYNRIESVRIEKEVPSSQLVIIRPDTTFILNFGDANLKTGSSVNDKSMFRAGSVSKSVAGVAMLILIERGVFSLEQHLTELAPELSIRNPWYGIEPVRLKHLLEAGAGFVGINPKDYEEPANPPDISVKKVVESLPYRLDVQWKPGYYTAYHDLGPTVSAYLIETHTGMRYEDFVDENIFKPLEMSRSSFFLTDTVKKYLVHPANINNTSATSYEHYKTRPSGSLNTSALEFTHFVKMLLARGEFKGARLLSEQSIKRMERSTTTLAARNVGVEFGYGINNYTTNFKGIIYHGHAGNTSNYTAMYGYQPELGTGFVFMSTVSKTGTWMLWEAVAEIFDYLHPDPDIAPALKIDESDSHKVVGCYQRLNPHWPGLKHDHVKILNEGDSLKILHVETGKSDLLELIERPFIFRLKNWRFPRDEFSTVVFTDDDEMRLVFQITNYPFEAYGKVDCNK